MARSSTFEDSQIFAAVGVLLARDGAVTLQAIVAETGVSIGSLYHRYGSRETLLARTWLDAVGAFQAEFLAALDSGGDDAGERAALVTPQFCRNQKARAVVLACCRQSEFASAELSEELQRSIASANDAAAAALREFADDRGYTLEACRLGLVAFPLAAVRLYLPDNPVPESIDAYVAEAFRSITCVQAA
ncbi:MAG: TetR/AcrR family transcriptional regulator [Pseudomonadota bacterium]